jgi:hypothetical protein
LSFDIFFLIFRLESELDDDDEEEEDEEDDDEDEEDDDEEEEVEHSESESCGRMVTIVHETNLN